MIDYIIARIPHEPGCSLTHFSNWASKRWPDGKGPIELHDMVPDCDCPRAEAVAWLERREAFVEAFRAWHDAQDFDVRHRITAWDSLIAAFARLEGE